MRKGGRERRNLETGLPGPMGYRRPTSDPSQEPIATGERRFRFGQPSLRASPECPPPYLADCLPSNPKDRMVRGSSGSPIFRA
jgi:hypothetical protein